MGRGSAPIRSSHRIGIHHLQDQDTAQDLYFILKKFTSFRTWETAGLRGRARESYYRGFEFTNPGQLPEPYRQLYVDHATQNNYTVFIGDTPIAWHHAGLGWVAPSLEGFSDPRTLAQYEKAHNAVLAITGKGALL